MTGTRFEVIFKKVVVVLVAICVVLFTDWIGYKMFINWHNKEQNRAVAEAIEREEKKIAVLMAYNKISTQTKTVFDKFEEKLVEEEYVFDADCLATEINDISDLATVDYIYTNYGSVNCVKNYKLTGWKVPFSSKELVVVMRGSIKIGVDCSKIEFDVNELSKTITIKVPTAKIISNELYEDSLVVCVEDDSLFNDITTEDGVLVRQQIKNRAEADVYNSGLLKQAEEKAAIEVEHLLESIPEVSAKYTIKIV